LDGVRWLENVESMTEREFEIYLDKIRENRGGWLSQKLSLVNKEFREKLKSAGDETLITLATQGHSSETDPADVQVQLTHASLAADRSSRLHSTPHRVFGLSYSPGPPSPSSQSGGRGKDQPYAPWTFPGRALDKVSQANMTEDRSRQRSNHSNPETGHPWVVSVGGTTGKASGKARIADVPDVERVDYTRANPEAGTARWRVTGAKISKPPTVLGLAGSRDRRKWGDRPESSAVRPGPMDTMALDVTFDFASPVQGSRDAGAGEIGERDWVAASPRSVKTSFTDDLGLGAASPRKDRGKGQAYQSLDAYERRGEQRREQRKEQRRQEEESARMQAVRLKGLLEKIGMQSAQGQGRGQGGAPSRG
jgi:hypothetical protein